MLLTEIPTIEEGEKILSTPATIFTVAIVAVIACIGIILMMRQNHWFDSVDDSRVEDDRN